MKTAPATRSGCSAARMSPRGARAIADDHGALGAVASSTARASSANSRSSYARPVGRSDRPLPGRRR